MRKRTSVIVKIIFLIGLLTMSTPLNESKAESNQTATVKMGNRTVERPSKNYPLGVASDATMFAGKNMVIDGYQTNKMNGEFYAGHFLVGTSVNDTQDKIEYPDTVVNNFTTTAMDLPNNLDPSIVSATAFSKSMIKVITNQNSLIGKQGETGHYVMGESSDDDLTDSQITGVENNADAGKSTLERFKQRAYQLHNEKAYLGDINYFKDNHVSTAEQAISNVTNVSDYYANLTATEYDSSGNITGYKQSVFSDPIKAVGLNSKAVNGQVLNGDLNGEVIQVNIDMNTTSTETGVAVVDIDGAANNGVFQKATGISINLLNYTQGKQKVPYVILNFHNFSSFNFENSSTYTMSAYTPAQVQLQKPDNNKYYPQNQATYNQRLDLTPSKSVENDKIRFETASHVLNNFNTLNGNADAAITLHANKGSEEGYSFIGTVLAPHTSINVIDTEHEVGYSFAGNVITNNSIYLAGDITIDKAFGANFNSDGDFPGTSDLEPTTKVPRILSVDLPNGVNFSPENATTNYVFEYSLNNNTAIDPPSSTMH